MKVLDTGSKQLTDAELLHCFHEQHGAGQTRETEARARNSTLRSRPQNQTALIEWVESRLTRLDAPTPFAGDTAYDATTAIPLLCTRLEPYHLTKPELLQIFNLRPWSTVHMTLIIEDFEARFDEEQQHTIITIIYEVLGGSEHPFAEGTVQESGETMNGD